MAKMPKELSVVDFNNAKTVDDLKRLLDKQNKILQEVYRRIHNDINWKETIHFSVRGKKWRITVIPGDYDGDNTEHLRVQRLTGTNWRNPSHWTDEHIWHGGPPVTEEEEEEPLPS